MDLTSFVSKWKGEEVVAFAGAMKYRGTLEDVLDQGFLVMSGVAVMNPAASETSEYVSCLLNTSEISGLAYQEVVGRGGAESAEGY
jgi:hypothetical protein